MSPRSPLVPDAETTLIESHKCETLIHDWKESFQIDIGNDLQSTEEIQLFRCNSSDLEFFTPKKTTASTPVYRELGKFDWYYTDNKWEFAQAAKDISGAKRILDVGCGSGAFVRIIKDRDPETDIRGIDSNSEHVQAAKERGLPVTETDISDLIESGEDFDAVCSFQVLEHSPDPLKFIRDLLSLLKDNGLLVLSMPNRNSFIQHQYTLLDMPPHHMTRWSIRSLGYLQELLPIKLLKICYEPLSDLHTPSYLKAYRNYWNKRCGSELKWLSDERLDSLSSLLVKTHINRALRGQSMYALFRKKADQ